MGDWVRWSDAKKVFELLHEVDELGREPLAWRAHFVERMLPILGAGVALAGEASAGAIVDPNRHCGSIDRGWATESDRKVWLSACERTDADLDPSDVVLAGSCPASFSHLRAELVDNRRWRRCKMLNDHYRPAALADYMVSSIWLQRFEVCHFVLFLAPAGKAFGQRELALLGHAHRELGERIDRQGGLPLPRYLDDVLVLLEAGAGEKEIAERLQRSPHTVREYCKVLHRRFGVHNRGALIAAARRTPRALRLSSDLEPARAVPIRKP